MSWTVEVTYLSLYTSPLHVHQCFRDVFVQCTREAAVSCIIACILHFPGPTGAFKVSWGRGVPCRLVWWQLSWPGWTNECLCICMSVIVCVYMCICMCAHTCLCGHVQVCVNLCYYKTRKCVHEAKEKYIYRSASMCVCVCEFILLQDRTACS